MTFKINLAPLGRNNALRDQAADAFVKYKEDRRSDTNEANPKVTLRLVHIIHIQKIIAREEHLKPLVGGMV